MQLTVSPAIRFSSDARKLKWFDGKNFKNPFEAGTPSGKVVLRAAADESDLGGYFQFLRRFEMLAETRPDVNEAFRFQCREGYLIRHAAFLIARYYYEDQFSRNASTFKRMLTVTLPDLWAMAPKDPIMAHFFLKDTIRDAMDVIKLETPRWWLKVQSYAVETPAGRFVLPPQNLPPLSYPLSMPKRPGQGLKRFQFH